MSRSASPSDAGDAEIAGHGSGRPRVSVVIPVYNVAALLRSSLDSVLAQDLPPEDWEIVAVDDGSTDGSGAILDAYAAAHVNVSVIHQGNSGWPGQPRNAATARARGDYVFYMDADDLLTPHALRRMVAFADEHGSDVVVVRRQQLKDGRPLKPPILTETHVDAPLELVFRLFGPFALLRRSFLQNAGLRFPEGHVRLEDGIFMTQAYLLASRVSTLGDADYYLRRNEVEGGSISRRRAWAEGYAESVGTIIDLVRRLDPDPRRAERIVLGVYRRKALRWFRSGHFEQLGPHRQKTWVKAIRGLAGSRIPPELEAQLPELARLRSRAVRRGDTAALVMLAGGSFRGWAVTSLRAGVRTARGSVRGFHATPGTR